jgi:carboxymethylenebutenolidase
MTTATWNDTRTDANDGMTAEMIAIKGHGGDEINAYFVRPAGPGPFPGVVLVHHAPGFDEFYRETARRYAQHGYITICPNLFARFGHGTPDDAAAKARAEGGAPDETVIGDLKAGLDYIRSLPYATGKVGIMGTCSGGRQAYLTAATTKAFDAVVNCWGGRSVMQPEDLNPRQPVSPHSLTKDLNCPVLGIFGNDDQNPNPEMVNTLEAELRAQGKDYEFHRYDGAGHGFIYYDRPNYRQQQAMDAWGKIFEFFEKNLK